MIQKLSSTLLAVCVDAELGGSVVRIQDRSSGRRILAETPWNQQCSRTAPLPAGSGMSAWLERYPGGWQELLPNAGPALPVDGVEQTWHGEASLSPFEITNLSSHAVSMRRDLVAAPLQINRTIAVQDDQVSVTDRIRQTGSAPYRFLWQHHAAFGADLLGGPCRLRFCGLSLLQQQADGSHAERAWTVSDAYDLCEPRSTLDCVRQLPSRAWAGLQQVDGYSRDPLCAVLAWDGSLFPLLWLWQETGGSKAAPWFGRFRAMGLEPAQSWPVTGLAGLHRAAHGGGTLLEPGQQIETTVALKVGASTPEALLAEVDRAGWPSTHLSGPQNSPGELHG